MDKEKIKKYQEAFINSLVEGNRFKCRNVMKKLRNFNLSILLLYEKLFK